MFMGFLIISAYECPEDMEFSYEAPGCPNSCENQNVELICAIGMFGFNSD